MMEAVARGGTDVTAKQQPQSASTNTTSKGAGTAGTTGTTGPTTTKASNVVPSKQMALNS